jgi:Xaa-Pro aminopeptidase
MFIPDVYIKRRIRLHDLMKTGIALFLGNTDSAMNYPGNTYYFRQDSDFLYYFGIDLLGFAGIMDFDSGNDYIFGNDLDIDDIVWNGIQPSVRELAAKCGITLTLPYLKLAEVLAKANDKGREIHFLPPYRGETKLMLCSMLEKNPNSLDYLASVDLIKAVISMRSIKEPYEIAEIEKAIDIAYEMHITAMKMCKPGVKEQDIFGTLMGIAHSKGSGPGFSFIISLNGQTLHNHNHSKTLKLGRLMVNDSGVETNLHYTSDITRTTPVGGKFDQRQKEIYEIVLMANTEAIKTAKPGFSNLDLHLLAGKIIASGLKDIGLMRGDIESAVEVGAHALFFPHGLGHLLGLDAHDMEALGEEFIGYDESIKRSNQFGLSFLRFAKQFVPGHVLTIEPGCYFIPELVNIWKTQNKFIEFINYDKIKSYLNFGGVRIEDNILITENGSRVLGKPIPKTIDDVEYACFSSKKI